jgi:hypothetical protein
LLIFIAPSDECQADSFFFSQVNSMRCLRFFGTSSEMRKEGSRRLCLSCHPFMHSNLFCDRKRRVLLFLSILASGPFGCCWRSRPVRLVARSFEIQGFFTVFCLGTENVIPRCEECCNCTTKMENFLIFLNRFSEPFVALEMMVYV